MSGRSPRRWTLFLAPLFVLGVTRLGIEASVRLLPMHVAWIPAFLVYYVTIEACVRVARRSLAIPAPRFGGLRPLPPLRLLVSAIVLPALVLLIFFVKNVAVVPRGVLALVVLYALLNPYFEETFWRGLLDALPAPGWVRGLYSAACFGFSHYILWGAYWLADPPRRWIAAAISTFVMGLLWSWFYRRDGRLSYPLLSHALVDVFNLSVALFWGVKLVTV
jgi:uncharacterized protein